MGGLMNRYAVCCSDATRFTWAVNADAAERRIARDLQKSETIYSVRVASAPRGRMRPDTDEHPSLMK